MERIGTAENGGIAVNGYFRVADQKGQNAKGSHPAWTTVALIANESINQHFKSPAENFCRW